MCGRRRYLPCKPANMSRKIGEIKGRSREKKMPYFGFFLQIIPLPLSPNLDNLYNFFSDVEIQDLKVSLGLYMYICIFCIYYIYTS